MSIYIQSKRRARHVAFVRAPLLGVSALFAVLTSASLQADTLRTGDADRNFSSPIASLPNGASIPLPQLSGTMGTPVGSNTAGPLSPAGELSLAAAVGRAVAHHPEIRRAEAMVLQGRSEIAVAKAAWYPTVEYGLKPGYGSSYASEGGRTLVQGVMGINQLLYDFGRTSGAVAAARATMDKQRYLLADTTEAVAYRTAESFIDMAAGQAIVEAADRQVEAQAKIRKKIADRVHGGLSSNSELTTADAGMERAVADRLQAQTRLNIAAATLAELIGDTPGQVVELTRTRNWLAGIGAPERVVDNAPAVLASQSTLEAASARVRQARAERFPAVRLGASHSESTGRENVGDNTWVGVSLSGNFSLGGQARHRIAAARAEQQAAESALDSQRLSTRTALAAARTEVIGAVARMESYDRLIVLTRSSRDLYWSEYTLDKRLLTEVLNAERDIYLAEAARIQAIADETLAVVKTNSATGSFIEVLNQPQVSRP